MRRVAAEVTSSTSRLKVASSARGGQVVPRGGGGRRLRAQIPQSGLVGAVAFELLAGQPGRRAVRSGLGAAAGLLVGRLAELSVSVGLIASFFFFSVLTAGVLAT
jgi:hypothetical protein